MATVLTALQISMELTVRGSYGKGLDLSLGQGPLSLQKEFVLAFGTGAGKANEVWHDRRVLAGGADEGVAIDLAATLTNHFGAAATFANVKMLLVINRSDEVFAGLHAVATAAAISVGNTAANEFQGPFHAAGDGLILPAGTFLPLANPTAAGWTATAATGDILLIKNEDADNEACYDIVIAGEAA